MLIKLSWRNIWRNKRRSGITIASICFAVFFAIITRSMQFGSYENMIENVVGMYTGYLQVHKKGYWEDKIVDNAMDYSTELKGLKDIPQLKEMAPRLETFGLSFFKDQSKAVMILGINPEKEYSRMFRKEKIVSGNLINSNSQGLVIGEGLASQLSIGIGDSLVLLGGGYHGMSAAGGYPVEGIINLSSPLLNDGFIFAPLELAQSFISAPGMITALAVMPEEPADTRFVQSRLISKLDTTKYEIMDWKELMPELIQAIEADSAGGMIMLLVLYLIISFGVFGTFLMLTTERQYEYGVLISLGMSRITLILVTALEVAIMSMVGVFFGWCLSLPVVYYFHIHPIKFTGQAAEAMKGYGMEAILPTVVDFSLFLTHGGVMFLVCLGLALYPLLKILFLKPVEAMKV